MTAVFLEKPDPSDKERKRARRRRWTVPPPVGATETLEGSEILEELPNAAGLELFGRLRDVLLWNGTPEPNRLGLFTPEPRHRTPDVPERLQGAVAELRRLTRRGRVSADAVAAACSEISNWAYEEGHLAVAISYGYVAASVRPDDPELAFAVGRAARDAGRHGHADAWFQRAIALARRANNPEMQTASYFGTGVLHEQRGDSASARKIFEKALRTATTRGLAGMAAVAHQYLIALTVTDFGDAFSHATAALRLFPNDDPRLARLAIDAGALFSEHSYFSLALALYNAAVPFLTRVSDKLAAFANIGRAAAAMGQKQRFAEAWAEFDRLALGPIPQFYGESLVELAHGLATLEYWKHAVRALARANTVAGQTASPRLLAKIQRLEALVRARERADRDQTPPAEAEEFTARLRALLAAQAPNRRTTPEAAPE